jgi:hypothetical protein
MCGGTVDVEPLFHRDATTVRGVTPSFIELSITVCTRYARYWRRHPAPWKCSKDGILLRQRSLRVPIRLAPRTAISGESTTALKTIGVLAASNVPGDSTR